MTIYPYVIGWRPIDSQKRTYMHALYDDRHEAEGVASQLQNDQPGYVFFVDVAKEVKTCSSCDGKGKNSDGWCSRCHGKGRVMK